MKHRAGAPDLEWLHPENFCNEQLYCETPHHPADVLYEGSDDETYKNSEERRTRYANQARRFLKGQPVFLLSASLRGPFDQESGWANPWRSKSGPRNKRTLGTKPPVAERAADLVEPEGISESSSPCEEREIAETQQTLPRTTYEPPLYLDDEVLYRVQHWRDQVVAESDAQTNSDQGSSQPASASVDSKKAAQHTTNRTPSGMRSVAVNNSQDISSLNTPGMVDQMRQPIERQGVEEVPHKITPAAKPKERTESQDHSSSELSPPPTDLADPHYLSPHAVRIYGQLALSAQIDAVDTTSFENTPVETPSRRRTIFEEQLLEEENVTPVPAFAHEAVSSTLVKTEASDRADGSFCYQTKGAGRKGAARRKSKLAGSPTAPTEAMDSAESESAVPPEPVGDDVLEPGPNEAPVGDMPFIKTEDVPDAEPATTTPHTATNPQLESAQSVAIPNSGTAEQNQVQIKVEDDDSTQSSFPIDGPTLVPSQSPSHSDHASEPSFGHFSIEKHSQEMISDAIDFPRRLLWPKSRRSQDRSPTTVCSLERVYTPASLRSGPSTRNSRAASSDYSPVPEAGAHESINNREAEVRTEQRQAHVNEAVSEMEVGPANAPATYIKTEEQVVEEDMQEQGLPQVELHPASDEDGDAINSQPPASSCPQPQTQSPWVQDDRPVRPKSQGDHHNSHHLHHSHHHHDHPHLQSSPKPIQSPWAKMADVVPDVSGTVAQLPNSSSHLHPAAATPSLTSAQNLQPTATLQSPWARGDSQMQPPDVRLFNPLSSPANTHVLPATDPSLPRSPVLPTFRDGSGNNDTEMGNSQLYPLPPSTPQTKQSSLPTPDVTLSVKSFKNFMTPSPQRPQAAKRRRISTDADGALPSTQALVDAAISNPWIRPPTEARPPKRQRSQHRQSSQPARPRKRVSWGPLPGEEENEDEENQTPNEPENTPTPTTTTNPPPSSSSSRKRKTHPSAPHSQVHPPRARATSPPPSILSASSLPSTNQKFGKHFAAVAGRRVGTTPLLQRTPAAATAEMLMRRGVVPNRKGKSLLPSDSQQMCGSPAVDAMAEAFLRAERVGGGENEDENASEGASASGVLETGGEQEQAVTDNERDQSYHEEGDGNDEQEDNNTQEDEETDESIAEPEPEPEAIDEVSAVMENLDDFLGGNWDLDADLAQAKAERNQAQAGGSSSQGGGLSGLMDVGVWD